MNTEFDDGDEVIAMVTTVAYGYSLAGGFLIEFSPRI